VANIANSCSAEVATIVGLNQSVVWIDEKEARVLSVDNGLNQKATIPALEVSEQASVSDANAPSGFFYRVARALDWADEIVIVGPSSTKDDFVRYMHKNDHAVDPRILGSESIANPNDSDLLGFAKLYFRVGIAVRGGNGTQPSG
jgi:stalled ribosome rescue protein Dom34